MQSAPGAVPLPIVTNKIVINHYHCKSLEEYRTKCNRGDAVNNNSAKHYTDERFSATDHNEEFDDGILKYRDARAKVYQPLDKSHADERLLSALEKNLSPVLKADTPQNFYHWKMEMFLTCRAVASYLKTKLADDKQVKLFEEASLKSISQTIDKTIFADLQLLIRELPNLLTLPYPAAKEIHDKLIQRMPKFIDDLHLKLAWQEYVIMDNIYNLLKIGG